MTYSYEIDLGDVKEFSAVSTLVWKISDFKKPIIFQKQQQYLQDSFNRTMVWVSENHPELMI